MTSPGMPPLPNGPKDPILKALQTMGLPVTRENYLALMDPMLDPDEPLDAEIEGSLPLDLQFEPGQEDLSLPEPPQADSPPNVGGTGASSGSESVYERELLDSLQERRPDLTREQLKDALEGHGF